jgi:hypothetical protein
MAGLQMVRRAGGSVYNGPPGGMTISICHAPC